MEHNHISVTIKLVSDLIEKRANGELAKHNITLSQARILSLLYHSKADSLSFKALEKLFGVSQATMQGTISRLAKKGYVHTGFLADDKKTKYVSITQDGKLLVANIVKCVGTVNDSIAEAVTEEEMAELNRIMTKIYNTMK